MERIGPYQVEAELGRGAHGAVFRARDPSGRRVALKVLLRAGEATARARFETEAKALARLSHPHLVRILDAGEAAGAPYLVMDYVEGGSLADRLEREGPLPPREAGALALKLAEALGAAHALGLLHRDVKPANVLLRAGDGAPLLGDFGLAKDTRDLEGITRTGSLLGTPGYLPPEQATGERGGYGPASDVYGLGATLYAALTGQAPFRGESLAEVLLATTQEPAVPPSRLRAGIDPALEAVCLRCLAKDPAERFPTGGALAQALAAALAGRPLPPAGPRGRSRAAPLLAAGLLGVGCLALLAAVAARGAARRSPAPAPAPAVDGGQAGAALIATDPVAAGLAQRVIGELRVGRAARARELAEQAAREHPDNAAVWAVVSQARAGTGDVRGGLAALDRVRELGGEPRLYVTPRLRFLCDLGQPEQALEEADAALTQLEDPWFHAMRARALRNLHRPQEAVAALDRALALGTAPLFLYERGQARREVGDLEGALEDFGRAMAADAASFAPYLLRGLTLIDLHRKDDALADLRRACVLAPGDRESWKQLALLEADLQDPAALGSLDRALGLSPRDARLLSTRGRLRAAAAPPDFANALADLDAALAADPRDAETIVVRAGVLQALGRGAEAAAAMDEAARVLAQPAEAPR